MCSFYARLSLFQPLQGSLQPGMGKRCGIIQPPGQYIRILQIFCQSAVHPVLFAVDPDGGGNFRLVRKEFFCQTGGSRRMPGTVFQEAPGVMQQGSAPSVPEIRVCIQKGNHVHHPQRMPQGFQPQGHVRDAGIAGEDLLLQNFIL